MLISNPSGLYPLPAKWRISVSSTPLTSKRVRQERRDVLHTPVASHDLCNPSGFILFIVVYRKFEKGAAGDLRRPLPPWLQRFPCIYGICRGAAFEKHDGKGFTMFFKSLSSDRRPSLQAHGKNSVISGSGAVADVQRADDGVSCPSGLCTVKAFSHFGGEQERWDEAAGRASTNPAW